MTPAKLHMRFIGAVAAISIALTGLAAAPAKADDDVAKILAALAGIAILGAVINDRRHDDQVRHQPQPRVKPYAQPRHKPRHKPRAHKRDHRYVDPAPRPLPRRFVLPSRCLRTVPLRNGQRVNAFGQGCLNKHYRFSNSLPRQCARADRGKNRVIYSYGARCLKNAGYKLARH